jgi:undecaprenyl-diphosphatase
VRWCSTRRDSPGRVAGRLVALWLGLLAAGVLLGLIVEGNGFDGSAVRSVAAERTGGVTEAARQITQLGGPWLDIAFAAAVAGLVLGGRRRDAAFVLLAAGGAMLVTNAIKFALDRPRPGGGGLVSVASASWPSGHASSSIAFYGALAVIAARAAAPGARVVAIWIGVAVLTGLVGASRVYLGVHYPSDVVAGWLVGGLWLLGVLRALAPFTAADRAEAGPSSAGDR